MYDMYRCDNPHHTFRGKQPLMANNQKQPWWGPGSISVDTDSSKFRAQEIEGIPMFLTLI